MTLKIEINMDNAAFEGAHGRVQEMDRIFNKVRDNLPSFVPRAGWSMRIMDVNGNKVGTAEINH